MDALEQKNLLVKESKIDLVGSELVIVAGKDNTKVTSLEDLTKATVDKISISTPESIPAGKYAQESLTNLKLWDVLKPKLVLAKDVAQVLNYVETGNLEAGFVYQSDAQRSTKVKVVTVVPASSHKPITYPANEAGDTTQASILVVIMTVFSFLVIYGLNRWRKRSQRDDPRGGTT